MSRSPIWWLVFFYLAIGIELAYGDLVIAADGYPPGNASDSGGRDPSGHFKRVTVPDVLDQDLERARVELVSAGLRVGDVDRRPDDKAPPNSVIGEFPRPGSQVEVGSRVDLIVARHRREEVRVPNLVGLPVKAAKKVLAQIDLDVGAVTEKITAKVPPAIVLDQTPQAGQKVERDSKVNLVISAAAPAVVTTLTPPAPQAIPGIVSIGKPSNVLFTLAVSDPTLARTGLNLVQVDTTDRVLSNLGAFHDDGRNGDKVAGDNVFSVLASVQATTAGVLRFEASSGSVTSSPVELIATSDSIGPGAAFAIEQNGTVVFQTAAGSVTTVIPLKNSFSVDPTDPSGATDVVEGTDAQSSTSGECSLIFTDTATFPSTAVETDPSQSSPTRADYYCGGSLAWSRSSNAGTSFLHDDTVELVADRGNNVLLVAVADDDPNQPTQVLIVARDGSNVISLTESLDGVTDAGLSSNGRFAFLRGARPDGVEVARFYDTQHPGAQDYVWDPDTSGAVVILENDQGSFSVTSATGDVFVQASN